MLILPLKYISCLVKELNFNISESLVLKTIDVGNSKRNLLILTFFDNELRKIIIKKLTSTTYTSLLLKKITM